MTPKEAPAFFELLAKLAVMHRIELDRPTARIYYEALADIPMELLDPAIDYLLKHAEEFMPKSERIREVCNDVAAELHASRQAALPTQNPLLLEGESAEREVKEINLPGGGAMQINVLKGVSGYACDRCEDTGREKVCRCDNPSTCTRNDRRADSDYCGEYMNGKGRLPVRDCRCIATNPEILRKRALRAKAPTYTGEQRVRQRGHKFPGNRFSYKDHD